MDINDTLLAEISKFSNKYGFRYNELENFITEANDFTIKKDEAVDLIKNIMSEHGKKEFGKHLVDLAQVEFGTREFKPRHRDHVLHSMFIFILGIVINEKLLHPDVRVNPFEWKLASLFHDIGYPIQIANSMLKTFARETNEIGKTFKSHNKYLNFKIVPEGFEKLSNCVNSFNLIQECIDKWGIQIDVKKEYDCMIDSGNIDHGIISSLAILNMVDLMYQEYNPKRAYKTIPKNGFDFDQKYFDNHVVSACSAIYIHNLPLKCFKNKISRNDAPVAFLLRLSDCLQEWDRPSGENRNGSSSNNFEIEFDVNKLNLHINLSDVVTKDQIRTKIEDEISCLDCSDVKIL